MNLYFFRTGLLVAVLFASCKKDKIAELDEDTNCTNITSTINDSLLTLVTNLTSSSVSINKIQYGTTTILAAQSGFEFWGPSISPDKSKFICFRSVTGNADNVNDYSTAQLWLFNIDGSNGHAITTLSAQGLNGMGMAKWAPDGFHIVFSGEKNETDGNLHWNIYLTDTLGTLGIKMNTRLGSFKFPSFANGDMTKLVYEAWIVGVINAGGIYDTEVHTATVDGSFEFTAEQKITNNGFTEYSPCYSADNSSLVYCQNTSAAPQTAVELYTYNFSTASSTKILSNNQVNENPVWCNANNKIYFINKTGTACFLRGCRIDPSGVNNAVTYQQTNSMIYHIDIK